MFEYATYNGVPIITYGLIGLTTGILALVTLNPNILELKEDGERTTIANAIGLDKIEMPKIPYFNGSVNEDTNQESTSYLPGINGLPQPFSTDNEDDKDNDEEDDSEYDEEEDSVENDDKESSIMNPLRQNENPSGGRKTRNKRKNKRQTKRNKK